MEQIQFPENSVYETLLYIMVSEVTVPQRLLECNALKNSFNFIKVIGVALPGSS